MTTEQPQPRKNQSPAIINRDSVLQRIAAGERLTDIATSLGFADHSAIIHRLKGDPQYMVAREVGTEARMENRERELERAEESVTVTRADRLLNHARWKAEREFPHRWGQKQEVTHNHQVTVSAGLVGRAGDLLERMRAQPVVAVQDQSAQADIVDAQVIDSK